MTDKFKMTLNEMAWMINDNARRHGFWPDGGRNFGEMIALAHSELSEALEEHRAGNPPVYFTQQFGDDLDTNPPRDKPEGAAVELVDCIIRCLDTLHSMEVDIDLVFAQKVTYNASRPHKHGKRY